MAFNIVYGILGFCIVYEVIRIWLVIILRRFISANWIATEAQLATYQLVTPFGRTVPASKRTGGHPYANIKAKASYRVKDNTFETKNVTINDLVGDAHNYSPGVKQELDNVSSRNESGSLYYNPHNPRIAVLSIKVGGRIAYEALLEVGMVAVAIGVFLFYYGATDAIVLGDILKFSAIGAAIGGVVGAIKVFRVIRALDVQV